MDNENVNYAQWDFTQLYNLVNKQPLTVTCKTLSASEDEMLRGVIMRNRTNSICFRDRAHLTLVCYFRLFWFRIQATQANGKDRIWRRPETLRVF